MPRNKKEEKEPKAKGKGKQGQARMLRAQRRKAYYSSRPAFTAANKKRKIGKHIRHFPEDLQAQGMFEKVYGKKFLEGHVASPIARARRRTERRGKEARKFTSKGVA